MLWYWQLRKYLTIGAIVFLPFKSIYLSKSSRVGISQDKQFREAVKMIPALAFFPANYCKKI